MIGGEPDDTPRIVAGSAHAAGITAEERGDTSRMRRGLGRVGVLTIVLGCTALVVIAGIWITRDGGDAPASAVSPSPSVSSTPGTDDGVTVTDDGDTVTVEGLADPLADALDDPGVIVALEDARLSAVSQLGWDDPVAVTEFDTVILSARPEPYGLGDLVARGAVRQDDATTFTLVQQVVVRTGARLQIDGAGATLRLSSTPTGWMSIVGWGGTIALNGADGAPLTVTSWDDGAGAADTVADDGRSYVLVRNGRLEASFTRFSDLGYWSGRTGGVAVLATDTGLASATLHDTEHERLHYGLFLSGVVGSTVTGSRVVDSTMHGVDVTGSMSVILDDLTVDVAGGDAVRIDRGSTDIAVTASTLTHAAGYGVHVDASALADGANPSGYSTQQAVGFALTGLTVSDNDRGGVLLEAPLAAFVTDSEITAARTALAVTGPADEVFVRDATLTSARGAGLDLSDGVTTAFVSQSRISGDTVAMQASEADVILNGNTLEVSSIGSAVALSENATAQLSGDRFIGAGQDAVQVEDGATATVHSPVRDWRFEWSLVTWLNLHPLAWLWLLVLVVPTVGLPFIARRNRTHRELRRLLQDAIIRYGQTQIEEYDSTLVPRPAVASAGVGDDARFGADIPADAGQVEAAWSARATHAAEAVRDARAAATVRDDQPAAPVQSAAVAQPAEPAQPAASETPPAAEKTTAARAASTPEADAAADAAARRAAAFRADLAASRGSASISRIGDAQQTARPAGEPLRHGATAPRSPVAGTRQNPAGAHRPAPSAGAQTPAGPRSLRDLRGALAGQDFASMQQFAVAAVLEAGYPKPLVARLFRVPSWRLESWIEETLREPTPPGRPPRR